eukprot:GHVN01072778.1.p1 GENE.GHVN01072778.1~~GHVN01072778.1.p1  ORF type:complete len:652 (+),score=42.76 GHVN01072778.1:135-2090(+)
MGNAGGLPTAGNTPEDLEPDRHRYCSQILAECGVALRRPLSSGRMQRVFEGDEKNGGPVVAKVLLPREFQSIKEHLFALHLCKAVFSIPIHPNVVPYQRFVVKGNGACVLRPYFTNSLYEVLISSRKLTPTHLKWIGFQLICGLCQMHSMGVAHGDLKAENVMLTSINHLFLVDMATYKPVFLTSEDLRDYSVFFETDSQSAKLYRSRCYLAPERFGHTRKPRKHSEVDGTVSCPIPPSYGSAPLSQLNSRLAMDIYSLGCVLAELFLGGLPILELPQTLEYASTGELPRSAQEALETLPQELGNVIKTNMLVLSPEERSTAPEILAKLLSSNFFPRSFNSCFYPVFVLLTHPCYQAPDLRVLLIRENMPFIIHSVLVDQSNTGLEDSTLSLATVEAFINRNALLPDTFTVCEVLSLNSNQPAETPLPDARRNVPVRRSFDHRLIKEWTVNPEATASRALPVLNDQVGSSFFEEMVTIWRKCSEMIAIDKEADDFGTFMEKARATMYHNLASGERVRSNTHTLKPPFGKLDCMSGEDIQLPEFILFVELVCATLPRVSLPRMRVIALQMLRLACCFSDSDTIWTVILPTVMNVLEKSEDDVVGSEAVIAVDRSMRSKQHFQKLSCLNFSHACIQLWRSLTKLGLSCCVTPL